MLVDIGGTDQWVGAGKAQGGMASGRSQLGADIHEIDNTASRCGRLLDEVAGDADAVAARRDEIIAAMAETAKPYFGDVGEMTYLQWLQRYVELAIGDGDDVLAVRDLARPMVALYVGGMGAKGRNFYNDLACRYGFEKEAAEIQDLYLAGRKREAEALVPDELLALTSLVGPRSWVAERVAAFRDAGVTHLQVTPVPAAGRDELGLLEELRQLVG